MRTDRSRINPHTRRLLEYEEKLCQVDRIGDAKAHRVILRDAYHQINSYPPIRSSRELDEFLQLSMLYISARLHFNFRRSRSTDLKVSVSLYSRKHNVFIIKPSYLFPGRCSILHPTILLPPIEEGSGQAEEPTLGPEVGLSGLVLASGEVLHCTRLHGRESCIYYVPLESPSASALSIPLMADLTSALDRFLSSRAPASGFGPHCCACQETVHTFPRRKNSAPTYGVLNIDCNSDELSLKQAKKILGNQEIRHVLGAMASQLIGYQADRAAYRVLRNCTSLFKLSQHTLGIRQAYVALLREISVLCDGADVTLHLRDMFKEDDRDRSVKLVAGFGSRFRGFLIGERYGYGLVGEAI